MFEVAAVISGIVLVVALGLLFMAWSEDLDDQDAQARDSSRMARRRKLHRAAAGAEGGEDVEPAETPAAAPAEPEAEAPAAPAAEAPPASNEPADDPPADDPPADDPAAPAVEGPAEAKAEPLPGPTWVASAESESSV